MATLEDFLRKCNEQISGSKNEIALRPSKANQYIYGAIFSVDDDVRCDKDSVEDREVTLISELNTGWSSKENISPQQIYFKVNNFFLYKYKKKKCRVYNFLYKSYSLL
jgi:hypothetical protein